jgi:S-adenosylmethionine decarboxylase
MNTPIGTHIMGDLMQCDPDYLFALKMEEVKKKVSEIITKYGLTELGSYYHPFDNSSFTGVVALSESHVSMHTWPELGIVNVDVYTCNYQRDNTEPTRKAFAEIAELFKPGNISKQEIRR